MGKRVNLGNQNSTEFMVPNTSNITRCFKQETIFVFGSSVGTTNYRWCLGVGRVCKIKQGENFDLLYLNFGKFKREIIVQNNHARRQLLTLKCGQLSTFYGKFKYYKNEKGETKCIFYAIGLQAWYVPKALDIKRMDLETYERIQLEQEKSMINLIDELTGNKENK